MELYKFSKLVMHLNSCSMDLGHESVGIRAGPVTSYEFENTTPQNGLNEDVWDLSGGDCDAPI